MATSNGVSIRRAEARDVAVLGRLGASLIRTHHGFDPQRFFAAGERAEEGYGRFLQSQLEAPDAVVLVAERDGQVVGYVFAGIEPKSWLALHDTVGFIHDVVMDPGAQRHGVGSRLIEAAATWLQERGMPRVMLWTAERNEAGRRMFERLGFRRTMIEMTRETGSA